LYGIIGTMSNCNFRNNFGQLLLIYGSINLENNIFQYNDCGNEQCLNFQIYSLGEGWEMGNITRNEFLSNVGSNIIEFGNIFGHAHIIDNTFNGNQLINSFTQALIKVSDKISIYKYLCILDLWYLWSIDNGIQFHHKS
jgi:hypothetical protein